MTHQGPPHRDHLLLAPGERPRKLGAAVVDEREERVDALEVVLAALPVPVQVRAELQVFEHGHRPEEPPVLGHDRHSAADPVARGAIRDVLTVEGDAARVRPDDPEDRLQRRRLPRGVAAEQRDELARADLELDVLEDVDQAVERVDPGELQEGRRGFRHFRSAALVPRYASTTRGSVATSPNDPSAILTPWSSAITRSEIPSTTCMSCSITRIV